MLLPEKAPEAEKVAALNNRKNTQTAEKTSVSILNKNTT